MHFPSPIFVFTPFTRYLCWKSFIQIFPTIKTVKPFDVVTQPKLRHLLQDPWEAPEMSPYLAKKKMEEIKRFLNPDRDRAIL